MSSNRGREGRQVVGLFGVGLDNKDGHRRLTRADNFVVVGGSAETHESMQEVAIRFNEALARRGKKLPEATAEEVIDLLDEASDV